MALVKKQMYAGTLGTTAGTLLYTPPASGAIIKEIVVTNKSASAVNVTIVADGVTLIPSIQLAASGSKDAVLILALSTVLPAVTDTITGFASAASAIDCIISGMEG